ncbi:hypothetical protein AVEN_202674-1 [Araneus ventricosus]|uniref:Uncharacterized protein n=1 Tax=Araneus ventricosus TaxID=182803 RepID=A0A4Y2MSF3_ARAVE|nr:hypothetical protein AVEN_202674-1 [Araneus ventricosus]
MPWKKRLCTCGISVFVKIAQTSKMTLGLGVPDFISEGRTANKELYLEILKRLRDAIRRKRPEKWATNVWFLLDDIAPPHRALIVKKYLARHSVTTLE